MIFYFSLILISALVLAVIIAGFSIYNHRKLALAKMNFLAEQKFLMLEILVPKNNEKTPLAAEQMFAALHGIFHQKELFQKHLSFELAARDKYIQFYAYVPEDLKDFVEGQIYAQYPTVEMKVVDESAADGFFDIELANSKKIIGCELKLTKNEVLPIKTFVSFDVDPLAGITGVLSKASENEQIWIQNLIRPVSDKWQQKGINYINSIKAGGSGKPEGRRFIKLFLKGLTNLILEIMQQLMSIGGEESKKKESKEKSAKELSGPAQTALGGVELKMAKLGYEVLIRVLVAANTEVEAKSKLLSVIGAYKQFNTIIMNGFVPTDPESGIDFLHKFKRRDFSANGYILNIEELASLYHLPNMSVETPSIVWAGSKKGEPPANLPWVETVPTEQLTVFAKTDFRHISRQFGIKLVDRRLHMYGIGKTGTGKSTLLENMVIDDIREGRGVAVVDPHGDLIKHVLDVLPAERIKDVVYFNPADYDFPVAFNLLENVNSDMRSIVASGLMSIFTKIWENVWSARMEYILRNAILALLEMPNSTLLGIMKILNDKNYRQKAMTLVTDPVVRDFFINEFEKYDPKFRNEAIAPIQNKVGQFLSTTIMRNIVGQAKSTIDIADIMDNKKILLLDLSIGKIGEDASALLGAMMITKIQLTAMGRAEIPEEDRTDFYLYVDEFQNFATESFAVILSEARKYHLNLIMTNQYIAQMNEKVTAAIFGNVGTFVSFRVGATDAGQLVKEFEPVFEANDMVNLGNYQVYVKMAVDGVTRPAFSAITLPPIATEKTGNREKAIDASRQKYAVDREEVEKKINQWAEEASSQPVAVPRKEVAGFEELSDKKQNNWYVKKS